MSILGIAAGFHDAALAVIDKHGDIVFAGHSERYSKIKHDKNLSPGLVREVCNFRIQEVAYYERPWAQQLRRLYTGEGVEWNKLTVRQILKKQIGKEFGAFPGPVVAHPHHLSHAAAGFQTSPFDRATVVVIDAIGEWDTITIWGAEYNRNGQARYKKLWQQGYPHSIGLFYSAMTRRVGLKPMDEEYILMGMAAYGERGFGDLMKMDMVESEYDVRFKHNLHTGVDKKYLDYVGDIDIAAGAQDLVETLILNVMLRAKRFGWSNNLVYGGGVALNCAANKFLGEYFDNIWIMPCPGDAGSSLGAAAVSFGRRINWTDAYLGHDIPGNYPVNDAVAALLRGDIIGVASGRAEFGPRALGNRSLLADPRGSEIKDQINAIKRRQNFRPFAPVVLEEQAEQYFTMPKGWAHSRYMQSIADCKFPELFPAIVHVDGTSRVQTVPKGDTSGIRELLEKWFVLTDCPMLLNTSLNIRGEPMVNDRTDADRFERLYGIKVYS